jgi:hypothetical protein
MNGSKAKQLKKEVRTFMLEEEIPLGRMKDNLTTNFRIFYNRVKKEYKRGLYVPQGNKKQVSKIKS